MFTKRMLALVVIGLIFNTVGTSANASQQITHKCNICGKIVITKGPCPQITCPRPIPSPKPNPIPNPKPKPIPGPMPVPQK